VLCSSWKISAPDSSWALLRLTTPFLSGSSSRRGSPVLCRWPGSSCRIGAERESGVGLAGSGSAGAGSPAGREPKRRSCLDPQGSLEQGSQAAESTASTSMQKPTGPRWVQSVVQRRRWPRRTLAAPGDCAGFQATLQGRGLRDGRAMSAPVGRPGRAGAFENQLQVLEPGPGILARSRTDAQTAATARRRLLIVPWPAGPWTIKQAQAAPRASADGAGARGFEATSGTP